MGFLFFSLVSNKEALEFSRMKAGMMQASLSLRSNLVRPWLPSWEEGLVRQAGTKEDEMEMQEMGEVFGQEDERYQVLAREEHMHLQELEEIDLG